MFGDQLSLVEETYSTPSVDPKVVQDYKFTLDFAAGLFGGCAGTILGHPFDTVKVKQHVTISSDATMAGTVQSTLFKEGVRGLFKGLSFPLASVGFLNSLFFGVYGSTLRRLSERHVKDGRPVDPTTYYGDIFLAGAIGGAVQAIPGSPIELVKIKLQSQSEQPSSLTRRYTGPIDCIKYIHQTYGIRGCFKGLNAMILREVPSFSVYITSYQYMCDQMTPEGHVTCSVRSMLIAGGLAGCLSWAVNLPVDVIKSRLQADDLAKPKYRGFFHCAQESFRRDGMRIFWRGLPVTCIRAFPSNAVTFTVYSQTLAAMNNVVDNYY